MRYLKSYKLFEDNSSMKDDISDMLLELEDVGMEVKFNNVKYLKGRLKFGTYEFVISKKDARNRHRDAPMFDTSNLVKWGEVKDVVKRITRYVYSKGGQIRFFSDGIEWGVSDSNDFMDQYEGSDELTQFALRLLITEKSINESISISELSDDINDICLDITDDEYIVSDNLYLCDDPLPEPLTNRNPWIQISAPDNLLFDPK